MRFFVFLLVVLAAPVAILLLNADAQISTTWLLISVLASALLLWASAHLLRLVHPNLAMLIVLPALVAAFLVRASFTQAYVFSGRGFSSEFFAHLELKSFQVAMSEYTLAFAIVVIGSLAIIAFAVFLIKGLKTQKPVLLWFALGVSLPMLYLARSGAPTYQLLSAYARYTSNEAQGISNARDRAIALALLQPLRGTRDFPVKKDELKVSAPAQPTNLILVYLESFSEMLTENDEYPGLTPNLDALKAKHISFKNNYSSAYVTIEGIANSQCGTLMNMDSAQNSLTTPKGRLGQMPCLGDFLAAASYRQTFLGGSDLEYAGKGDFLKEHGYGTLLGRKSWREQGFKRAGSIWGLADSDLFEQALIRIRQQHALNQPFNVTLLTLGTHIPGYHYEGCPIYKEHTSKFLNAIHCTDFLVGKFVRQLRASGILEDTLLVFQGDHGVFNNKQMRALFGDQSSYRRILSLFLLPTAKKEHYATVDQEKVVSSEDLVATLLDLLEISNNSEFVLSNSMFKPTPGTGYKITRYSDRDRAGAAVNNNPRTCDAPAKVLDLSPPLGNCEKKLALETIYAIGIGYAAAADRSPDLCGSKSIVTVGEDLSVAVSWGGQDLSDRFIWHGRKLKNRKPGFYFLNITASDNIVQQQFFSASSKRDLKILNSLLVGLEPGARFLLIRAEKTPVEEREFGGLWPPILAEDVWVYGQAGKHGLQRVKVGETARQASTFYPATCGDAVFGG